MYAPLLRRYQTDSSISGGCDGSNNSISSISDWTHDKLKKKPSLQTIEQHAAAAIATSVPFPDNSNNSHCSQRPVRLVPSPSAPSHSSLTNGTCCNNSFIPATNYYRYYPEQHWNDENEEYEYDYSSEGTNNDDGTSNKQQQQEHGQWKSWFHHQHSQHHHYHQEEQQRQQQQPLLLPQSPLSPCVFCYNPVPKKCLSAGDVEETRFFPSSTSGDSSTEDNQSTSYHSAVASDHLMLKEIEEYHNENNNNEASPLLSKSTTLFGSNKHLDEQDQADLDDKYNNLVTNYGILGTTGGSSSSNSGGGIIRSESSISAFRPISKNLAPRCSAALVRDKSITLSTSKQFIYRDSLSSSSSSSSTNPAGVDDQQFNSTKNFPTITKSQSFPSKVAAMSIGSSTLSDSTRRPALPKMASYSTPRPIGGTGSEKRSSTNNNKERNFVMRSIVGKKASLSKLFHAKKY
ncbi:hypothetical protein BDC45DRAFT_520288 [Circinella umbellata]|nr:hypothetical protein BDC45DRAFT_520288 [Circinella umbellata]